jgi:hypothetical protein
MENPEKKSGNLLNQLRVSLRSFMGMHRDHVARRGRLLSTDFVVNQQYFIFYVCQLKEQKVFFLLKGNNPSKK